jgi:hypothetical protein
MGMKTKKVQVYKWAQAPGSTYNTPWHKEKDYLADFVQFSTDSEECDNGAIHTPCAIVIQQDGMVTTVPAFLIQFLEYNAND